MDYLFSPGSDAVQLVSRLRKQMWWGQIVGPHGSGKSTLLCTLVPHIQNEGRTVVHFTLHDGQRSLPVSRADMLAWDAQTQVIVDGYEQLSWWSRWQLKRACRSRRCGLLVTAHRPVGLTELCRTSASVETTQSVVARLLRGETKVVSDAEVARCFHEQQGNVREVLFALYDLYEQRRQ
jgi:ABC-type cobalamin/Fe3+-siderophores transport system ATPase subunit